MPGCLKVMTPSKDATTLPVALVLVGMVFMAMVTMGLTAKQLAQVPPATACPPPSTLFGVAPATTTIPITINPLTFKGVNR